MYKKPLPEIDFRKVNICTACRLPVKQILNVYSVPKVGLCESSFWMSTFGEGCFRMSILGELHL